jgi:hypothetical protein
MAGNPEIAARGYLFRRAAHTHHDDGGDIAAMREHFPADPTCIPIVVSFRRTVGEH